VVNPDKTIFDKSRYPDVVTLDILLLLLLLLNEEIMVA